MVLASASQLESDLIGYGICIFLITFGLLFYFYFNNRLAYIGIPFTFWGLLFLSVQLDINNQSGPALFVVGLTFLVTQLYLKNENNKFFLIVSFFLLSFAITFFCVAGLYMVYEGGQNSNLFSFVEQFVSFAMALLALIQLVRRFISFKSKSIPRKMNF